MKKFALAVIAVVLIALAVLLATPSLIDWNAYRRDVAAVIARATGRTVTIAGNLDFSLLPTPRLTARRVSVASIEGAVGPTTLRVAELRMELAPRALLAGRVTVRALTLIDPVLTLETTADGRRSWEFAPMAPARARGAVAPAPMSFDAVTVANGSLVWLAAKAAPRRLDAVDATLSLADPGGAVRIRGHGKFRDLPVDLAVSVGRTGEDGAAPVSATLDIAGDAGRLSATGRADFSNMSASGKIRFTAQNAAGLARLLSGDPLPGLPARDIELESAFTADRHIVAMDGLTMRYGDTRATGLAHLAVGEIPALTVALETGTADLDTLFAESGRDEPSGARQQAAGSVALPTGLVADIDLSVKVARWRGGVIRDLGGAFRLEAGKLQIERIAAKLPGGTNVTLSGDAAPADGGLRLDGDLAVVSDNLRAALAWAGVAENSLPAGRLRGFSYTSRITVLPEAVHLAKIVARLDATHMTGAATIARRKRPALGIRLALDRIGLDAYLPQAAQQQPAAGGGLPAAARFDANLDISVGSLTWRGKTFSQLALDARLFDGDVDLRKFSAGDVGGAALSASGRIDNLPAAPRGDLKIALKAADAGRFAQFAEIEAGPIVRRLGRFSLQAHAVGAADGADLDATLDIAGGRIAARGRVAEADGAASFDLAVTANHPDGDRVVGLFAPDRPDGGIGPMSVRLQLAGSANALTIRELQAELGGTSLAGRVEVARNGKSTKAVIALTAGLIDLDRLLPSPPESLAAPVNGTGGSARWSRETIDTSTLRGLEIDLSLRSDKIVRSGLEIGKFDLRAGLSGGVLTVGRLTGNIAGGRIEATAKFNAARTVPDLSIKVAGRDLPALDTLRALTAIDRVQGSVSLDLSLSSAGRSAFNLVSALAGKASVSGVLRAPLTEAERIGAGDGGPAGVILGDSVSEVVDAGDAIDTMLHAFSGSPAAVGGDFLIVAGVMITENLLLDGPNARALTVGSADFPGWRINSTTTLRRGQDGPEPHMVAGLTGPLDGPSMQISGAVLGAGLAQAPPPEAAPVIAVEPVEAE